MRKRVISASAIAWLKRLQAPRSDARRPCDSQGRFRRSVINHQFREHRQGRHALGHHQIAFAYLLAPIVNLPTCRAIPPRNIGYRHAGHQAFRRDPCTLCLRAPPPTTRPLDYFQPGNPNAHRAAKLDAHFAVSFEIQHLNSTCAPRMQASGQKRQEGVSVALTNC